MPQKAVPSQFFRTGESSQAVMAEGVVVIFTVLSMCGSSPSPSLLAGSVTYERNSPQSNQQKLGYADITTHTAQDKKNKYTNSNNVTTCTI